MLPCARRVDARIFVDGVNVVPEVHAVLDKLSAFAKRVRAANGRAHGQTHPQHC